MPDHEQRAILWFIGLVLLALGAYLWYVFIRPSPWGLVVGTEFWFDPRAYCLPCTIAGEPWGPEPDAPVARVNSLLGGLVLWMAFVFIFLGQIALACAPVVYGLYRLSHWVEARGGDAGA